VRRYDLDSLENRDPERIRRLWRLLGPPFRAYFRPVVRGLERIPPGPVLYVGNHNGFVPWDAITFFGEVLDRRGVADLPYALGHDLTMSLPVVNQLFLPLGVVRASHGNAHKAFAAGHKVLVYPGSDYDSFRAYRDRNRVIFGRRRGYLALALRAGVPIVPVVSAGAHEVFYVIDDGQWLAKALRLDRLLRAKAWPIVWSLPWGLTVGPPLLYFPLRSRFYQEALEPIRFERTGAAAAADRSYVERCHERVLGTMQAGMDRLVALREAGR
jgi:1-acyl-sn-glycerol-3-phosphate acyltransferase